MNVVLAALGQRISSVEWITDPKSATDSIRLWSCTAQWTCSQSR